MATMLDVARKAGVSLSTVSHVVNGTRFVNPQTAVMVRSAIASMDYSPNTLARSLATATTHTVGIAISISTNYYFNDIVSSIERACASLGQLVFLCDTQNDPATELKVVRELVQRRVDGVILAPSADPENRAIEFLTASKVPFVLVDRLTSAKVDGVALQNRFAMETLVDHLVSPWPQAHRPDRRRAGVPLHHRARRRLCAGAEEARDRDRQDIDARGQRHKRRGALFRRKTLCIEGPPDGHCSGQQSRHHRRDEGRA